MGQRAIGNVMSNYHCSIYQIGVGIRSVPQGTRERKPVDPVARLNRIARFWKQWTGSNAIITWLGYRSQAMALAKSRRGQVSIDIGEYE